jgi:hypothetical protein
LQEEESLNAYCVRLLRNRGRKKRRQNKRLHSDAASRHR